mmetsp:Transcript_33885/g.78249  ORF Transcript_33885/g.78249 Transcript_33885/m.78249 type:complete len:312 (+) Transcript_33885:407-1342(+)
MPDEVVVASVELPRLVPEDLEVLVVVDRDGGDRLDPVQNGANQGVVLARFVAPGVVAGAFFWRGRRRGSRRNRPRRPRCGSVRSPRRRPGRRGGGILPRRGSRRRRRSTDPPFWRGRVRCARRGRSGRSVRRRCVETSRPVPPERRTPGGRRGRRDSDGGSRVDDRSDTRARSPEPCSPGWPRILPRRPRRRTARGGGGCGAKETRKYDVMSRPSASGAASALTTRSARTRDPGARRRPGGRSASRARRPGSPRRRTPAPLPRRTSRSPRRIPRRGRRSRPPGGRRGESRRRGTVRPVLRRLSYRRRRARS